MKTKYAELKDALDEFDKKYIKDNVVFVVHDYEAGCYDGSGNAISKNADGKWDYNCLGHCSCYGPTDSFESGGQYASLDDLLNNSSADLQKELAPLVKEIKRRRWNQ